MRVDSRNLCLLLRAFLRFDLQIEHERTGLNNDGNPTQTNDQLRVHLFGQVQKSIVVKGAAYNVVYN